jgi:Uncharacterized protein conserved in cyanobacteria
MSPSPSPNHQRVSRRLFRIFDRLTKEDEVFVAPIDLYINQRNVFQPDLAYIPEGNKHFITDRGIEGPPTIVIEIISPSNAYTDRNLKKQSYLNFGVAEYWIVDPGNKTIEIYTPSTGLNSPLIYLAEEGEVQSTVLKDLKVNLSELF